VVVINKASVLEKLETPSFFEKNKTKGFSESLKEIQK